MSTLSNKEILPGVQPVMLVVPETGLPVAGGGGSGGGVTITPHTFAVQAVPSSGTALMAAQTNPTRVSVCCKGTSVPVTLSYSATPMFDEGIVTLQPGGVWESPDRITAIVYATAAASTVGNVTVSFS